MAARDSGMSTKVLRRLKMSLDYNTRSFAPLANFAKVIFPLLSKGAHLVIYLSVIPAMGQTGTSSGNHF